MSTGPATPSETAGADRAAEPSASAPPASGPPGGAAPPEPESGPADALSEALSRPSNPILAAALLNRADDALARRDIAAARAFFVRAASVDPWSAEALVGAGKTYDPGFLAPLGANAGLADPAQARQWYARAAKLGDPAAAVLAGRLGDGR